MIGKQIKTLEELLSQKVSQNRVKEYQKYNQIIGATTEELSRFEGKYKIKLPDDFKEFYSYKNGSGYHFHILYPNCAGEHIEPFYLFSLEEMEKEKDGFFSSDELMSEYYENDEISRLDTRIKPYLMNEHWFPFASLAGGDLYLMLDYDPSEKGVRGQIISFIHDPDFIYFVANDLTELLEQSNDNLATIEKIGY